MVIDLLKKGYTTRAIAKLASVSFSYIKKIRQKLTGEVNEEKGGSKNKTLSLHSRAFKLFLENKSMVDVAIELDSPRQEVMGISNEISMLKNMPKVATILKGNKDQLVAFVNMFEWLRRNDTMVKDIRCTMDSINNIKVIEQRRNKLKGGSSQ